MFIFSVDRFYFSYISKYYFKLKNGFFRFMTIIFFIFVSLLTCYIYSEFESLLMKYGLTCSSEDIAGQIKINVSVLK